MKYWRGYLVAIIFSLMSRGLISFAQGHWELVDMVYPYVSRLVQNYLADWSSGIGFPLWQLLLIVAGVLVLATVVLMVVFKWNPIQWGGWVLAAVSIVLFLNTAMFGLNDHAGPVAQDLRLEVTEYTLSDLENAADFYLEKANELSGQVSRNGSELDYPDFETLAQMAGEGFEVQTYDRYRSIFAGSTVPVKQLQWSGLFSGRGTTGVTIGITGEAAVNPETPAVAMPFVICREMAKRMCITVDQDAAFVAMMACDANSAPEFRYAAYFMAYRYCYTAVSSMETPAAQSAAARLRNAQSNLLTQDLDVYNNSFAAKSDDNFFTGEQPENGPHRSHVVDLLVSWHYQEYVLPTLQEDKVIFDPMDETQVDLSGLPNIKSESGED